MQDIKKLLPGVLENVALSDYSTFQIGGLAKYFFKVKDTSDLVKAVKIADENNLPFFILGGGSNILFPDEGYKGLIIKMQNTGLEFKDLNIVVESGILLSNLVKESIERSLKGLEWAAGIYGTIGGAVRGNAGAFDGSISDLVKEVQVYDREDEETKLFSREDCFFGYRDSIFKSNPNLIILKIVLELKKGKKELIEEKVNTNLDYKKRTQPLDKPSIGSIFKNCQIKEKGKSLIKSFPELKDFKNYVPAGFLIEEIGLKGKRIGDAKISNKHANFIINLGRAKSSDVKRLIEMAKEKVESLFGIKLKEEVVVI